MTDDVRVYRLEGLSCADCAAQLERDVRELPGVRDARLDFGSARLTVWGAHDRTALVRLARQHDVTATPALDRVTAPGRGGLNTRERSTVASVLALVAAWAAQAAGPAALPPAAVTALLGAAIAAGGFSTFRKGVRALSRLRFDMNGLMTVAVAGAIALGEWWEGAAVAVLYGLGEVLEARTLAWARQSIQSLIDLAPRRATVLRDGKAADVDVDDVRPGDRVLVRPGQRIPVDGRVAAGRSSVDQSPVTGESIPVDKGPGDPVFSGSVNHYGALEIVAERTARDSTLSRIVHLVEEAQGQRAPVQKFVERFAAVYTPAVLAVAVAVATAPPLLLGQPWTPWVYRALTLLVVACPCALVVSTPVALVSAIGGAARWGVLIKGGAPLEALAEVRAVAFDKTGTLTAGRPEVVALWANPDALPEGEEEVLRLAASLEAPSEHPLARAVVARARHRGLAINPAAGFRAVPGLGVYGQVEGRSLWLGNRRLREQVPEGWEAAEPFLERWEQQGWAVMVLASPDRVLGALALADRLRPEVPAALEGLRRAGVIHTALLSGDHLRAVAAVADQAGIDAHRAELMPEEKVAAVGDLVRLHGRVAMVGDGINDAPALAAATVGIAMGAAGSDAALETADVVLMGDDLRRVADAIALSRRTMGVIKQNIAFSLAAKALALLAIAPGWLSLWLAILADMGATLIVSLNGVRLLFYRPPGQRLAAGPPADSSGRGAPAGQNPAGAGAARGAA